MHFTFRVQKNTDGEIQLGHKLSFTVADGIDALSITANSNGFTPLTAAFRALYLDYKDFENELSKAMGIPIGELTRCENGNRKGSMVHRRIALHLAHRISPEFEVQVTGYLDE